MTALLSYLPDQKKTRKAAFDDQSEIRGHPLSIRIPFGKIEQGKSTPREGRALVHSNQAVTERQKFG